MPKKLALRRDLGEIDALAVVAQTLGVAGDYDIVMVIYSHTIKLLILARTKMYRPPLLSVFVDLDQVSIFVSVVLETISITRDHIAVINDRNGTCMVMLFAADLLFKCHSLRREGEGSQYC